MADDAQGPPPAEDGRASAAESATSAASALDVEAAGAASPANVQRDSDETPPPRPGSGSEGLPGIVAEVQGETGSGSPGGDTGEAVPDAAGEALDPGADIPLPASGTPSPRHSRLSSRDSRECRTATPRGRRLQAARPSTTGGSAGPAQRPWTTPKIGSAAAARWGVPTSKDTNPPPKELWEAENAYLDALEKEQQASKAKEKLAAHKVRAPTHAFGVKPLLKSPRCDVRAPQIKEQAYGENPGFYDTPRLPDFSRSMIAKGWNRESRFPQDRATSEAGGSILYSTQASPFSALYPYQEKVEDPLSSRSERSNAGLDRTDFLGDPNAGGRKQHPHATPDLNWRMTKTQRPAYTFSRSDRFKQENEVLRAKPGRLPTRSRCGRLLTVEELRDRIVPTAGRRTLPPGKVEETEAANEAEVAE